jgi:hypothetical protein
LVCNNNEYLTKYSGVPNQEIFLWAHIRDVINRFAGNVNKGKSSDLEGF